MAEKKTKLYDYRQLSSGELNGEDGMGGPMYKATPFEGEGSSFVAGEGKSGAGRGKQGGPSADELETNRFRKYREAMDAEYESRAKMLGKTKSQYIKDQAAKENAALKKAPISDFMSDSGMKKGGSVKGWGIARGARKAKMY